MATEPTYTNRSDHVLGARPLQVVQTAGVEGNFSDPGPVKSGHDDPEEEADDTHHGDH